MNKYINAGLAQQIREYYSDNLINSVVAAGVDDLAEIFADEIPSADVRENIHGEWIESTIPNEKYVCSVCGGACWYYDYEGTVSKSRFCPNCGADMRTEK